MIGIVCAISQELDKILNFMETQTEENFASFKFVIGKLNNHICVAVLSGIGKVHAAICTQTLIIQYKPDFILNIGVAGGIGENINIGDIVVANNVIQHDFDISAFANRKKGEIPGIDSVKIPCSNWIVTKILDAAKDSNAIKTHCGIIVSGDQFIDYPNKLNLLKSNFGAIACEMEAGGIAQTCFINKVDFGIIRCISDNANSNANVDFYKFIESSSVNSANIFYEFIRLI